MQPTFHARSPVLGVWMDDEHKGITTSYRTTQDDPTNWTPDPEPGWTAGSEAALSRVQRMQTAALRGMWSHNKCLPGYQSCKRPDQQPPHHPHSNSGIGSPNQGFLTVPRAATSIPVGPPPCQAATWRECWVHSAMKTTPHLLIYSSIVCRKMVPRVAKGTDPNAVAVVGA